MPMLHVCAYPGCREAIPADRRYCEKHARMIEERKKEPQSDRHGGKSAAARGYGSRWRTAARNFLRAHPICAECERQGRITAAVCVDHIKPHRGNWALFWDVSNWQPLCARCHSIKTAEEDGGFGNPRRSREPGEGG